MEESSYHSRSLERARMLLLAQRGAPSPPSFQPRPAAPMPNTPPVAAAPSHWHPHPQQQQQRDPSPLGALRAFEQRGREQLGSAAAAHALEHQQKIQRQQRMMGCAQLGLATIKYTIRKSSRLPALLRWAIAARKWSTARQQTASRCVSAMRTSRALQMLDAVRRWTDVIITRRLTLQVLRCHLCVL